MRDEWGVYHFDTCHPLVNCYLILAREVVDVLGQARQNFPHPRRGLRTCSIDDILGEVGIEPVSLRLVIGSLQILPITAIYEISLARMLSWYKIERVRQSLVSQLHRWSILVSRILAGCATVGAGLSAVLLYPRGHLSV